MKYLIGIDEVGRGPIAGPVALGAVAILHKNKRSVLQKFKGVKESKQLSPQAREKWLEKIEEEKRKGSLYYSVAFLSSQKIDQFGLAKAIKICLENVLSDLLFDIESGAKLQILLDGGLKAPKEFINQKTIIKGDEKEPIIALASIVAKVTRDKRMLAFAKKYPAYQFDIHKGYGTKKHYQKIAEFGLCPIHRRSFLKGVRVV
jgi:ribonuclease HII